MKNPSHPESPRDAPGDRADQLIAELPRDTWQDRSFAYWADKQLQSSDWWWRPLSTAVIGATTTITGAFLSLGFRKVVTEDLHKLVDIIEGERDRPVITVANHESTMDDPVIWGVLPLRMRWRPEAMRWTLGARELLYKGPPMNAFFALGQTIPTVRGDGIRQLAVEIALRKLNENRWLHIFAEGRVNQDAQLLRFKWGVGRMIMEAERTPIVVPVFFRGMKEVMPLYQTPPVPRPNPFESTMYMRIGNSIDFGPVIAEWKAAREHMKTPADIARLEQEVRIAIVDRLWTAVDALGSDTNAAFSGLKR